MYTTTTIRLPEYLQCPSKEWKTYRISEIEYLSLIVLLPDDKNSLTKFPCSFTQRVLSMISVKRSLSKYKYLIVKPSKLNQRKQELEYLDSNFNTTDLLWGPVGRIIFIDSFSFSLKIDN